MRWPERRNVLLQLNVHLYDVYGTISAVNGIVGFLGVKSEYTILITHTHLRNVICTFFSEITISFRGCRTGMRTILLTTTSVVRNTPAFAPFLETA